MRAVVMIAPVLLLAQQSTPPPKENPGGGEAGGVFRIGQKPPEEAKPPAPPKPEEPKVTALTWEGKPLKVPYTCTDEDITSFGMTCTAEDPCPVYLELAGLQPLNQKIFVTGNIHNGSATMYSVLLASEDNGKHWTEGFERLRGAGLEQIQFYDFQIGWISGQLLGALPRDPFFLLTTDGGKFWRKRAVFGESRVSAIEQFYFDAKNTGTLIIDKMQAADAGGRYERYETQTGGESWMVREVTSKPLKIRNAKELGPPADWRLRADSGAKAHFVEHRSGQKWQTVSAFQVNVGECKPAITATPEPPMPPSTTTEAPSDGASGTFVIRRGTGRPAGKK